MNFLVREKGLVENAPIQAHQDCKSQSDKIRHPGISSVLLLEPGMWAQEGKL